MENSDPCWETRSLHPYATKILCKIHCLKIKFNNFCDKCVPVFCFDFLIVYLCNHIYIYANLKCLSVDNVMLCHFPIKFTLNLDILLDNLRVNMAVMQTTITNVGKIQIFVKLYINEYLDFMAFALCKRCSFQLPLPRGNLPMCLMAHVKLHVS